MTKLFLAIAAFLECVSAPAAEPITFSSPRAFVASTHAVVSQSAHADLNGDGLEDWVGAVAPASGEDPAMQTIMVLLQTSPGRYEVAGTSSRLFWSDASSDAVDLDIKISQATFYVSFTSHSRRCVTAARAQFRLAGNQWRIIGATYRESSTTDRRIWYSQDANLVTGDEILTVQGVRQRNKFSPLVLDLSGFPLEYNKAFRTKTNSVCG